MPDPGKLRDFTHTLAERKAVPVMLLSIPRQYPMSAWTKDILQSAVAVMGDLIFYNEQGTREPDMQKGTSIIAKMPARVAVWHRLKNNL